MPCPDSCPCSGTGTSLEIAGHLINWTNVDTRQCPEQKKALNYQKIGDKFEGGASTGCQKVNTVGTVENCSDYCSCSGTVAEYSIWSWYPCQARCPLISAWAPTEMLCSDSCQCPGTGHGHQV